MSFQVKRVYEPASERDGQRVLVDALWPRGISKSKAALAQWAREIAPSTALRKEFHHDPAKWDEFRRRYFQELDTKPEAVAELQALGKRRRVTLLYGARDEEHNNAVALLEYLRRH